MHNGSLQIPYWHLLDAFLISSAPYTVQLEDSALKLIVDILCKIYQGEVWTLLLSFSICCYEKNIL